MIRYQQDDEILKIFEDGKYLGFVDETQMLNLFDRTGHSIPVCNIESRAEISAIVRKFYQEREFIARKYKEGDIKLLPWQEALAQFMASGGDMKGLPRGVGRTVIALRAEEIKANSQR